MKQGFRNAFRWLAIFLVAVAGLAAAAYGFLQTPMAKRIIAEQATSHLKFGEVADINIEGVTGWLPFTLGIEKLAISDPAGPWLEVDGLRMRWLPWTLLRGHIHVDYVEAGSLDFRRIPHDPDRPEPDPFETPDLPEWWPHIQVTRIDVANARIHEEVFDHYAEYRVQGRVAPPAARNGVGARLDVERLDGPDERAEMLLQLLGEPAEVDLRAALSSGENSGLIAALARLPEGAGISTQLSLRGPLDDMKGELTAASAPIGETALTLSVGLTTAISIGIDGWAALAEAELPENVRELAQERIALGAALSVIPRERLDLGRLAVTGAGLDVLGEGYLDLDSEETNLDIGISAEELGVFSQIARTDLAGALDIRAEVAGALRHPHGHALIEGSGLRADTVHAEAVQARLDLESLEALGEGFPGFLATLEGRITALAADLEDEMLKPTDVTLRTVARAEDPDHYELTEASLSGEGFSVEATGSFWPEGLRGLVDAAVDIDDAGALPLPIDRPELQGPVRLSFHAEGSGKERTAHAVMEAVLGRFPNMPEPLPGLMGDESRIDAALRLADDVLTVEEARAVMTNAQVSADGAVDFANERLDLNWTADFHDLAVFDEVSRQRLHGALNTEGSVEGLFDDFAVQLASSGSGLRVNDAAIEALSAEATATGLPALPEGQASIRLTQEGEAVTTQANYAISETAVELAAFELMGRGVSVAGDMQYLLEPRLLAGELAGDIADLEAISAFIGEPLEGAVKLDAAFAADGGQQQADAHIEISQFSSAFASAEEATVSLNVADLFGAPAGSAAVQAGGVRAGNEAVVEHASIDIEGSMDSVTAALTAHGSARQPFEIAMGMRGDVAWPDLSISLDKLQGQYAGQPVTLREPSQFTIRDGRYHLSPTVLELLEGSIRLAGEMDSASIDATVNADELNLAALSELLPANIQGLAALDARLTGPVESPEGQAALTLSELALDHPAADELPPATLVVESSLRNGMARFAADVSGFADTTLEAEGETPAQLSLAPFALDWDTDTPIQGRLDAETRLEVLAALLLLDGQSLEGKAAAAFTLDGAVSNPQLTGTGEITDGYYENWELGTVLSDINATITAADNRIVIDHARMTDGAQGEITLSGGAELDADAGFPFDATLTLRNAYLVRQDHLIAAARGEVRAEGSTQGGRVTGNVTAGPVRFYVPERLPAADAPHVEYVEINKPGESPEAEPEEPAFEEQQPPDILTNLALDLRVNMPGRIYVQGRGLDSEWRGDLRVLGSAAEPRVNGHISVVRGHFDFLDNRFDLEDSQVTLDGSVPISPQLDISAVAQARDITARLRLTGPADNPAISMESEPPLPQDEILARVLFGRSLANITPLQAVQIVNAANILAGGGDTLDFFTRTRGALGLDQLELRGIGEEDAEATVALGRYFGDDVYVQMEQALGEGTSRVTVEVEVNRYLSLESEVGTDAEGGIGLSWKYDY